MKLESFKDGSQIPGNFTFDLAFLLVGWCVSQDRKNIIFLDIHRLDSTHESTQVGSSVCYHTALVFTSFTLRNRVDGVAAAGVTMCSPSNTTDLYHRPWCFLHTVVHRC